MDMDKLLVECTVQDLFNILVSALFFVFLITGLLVSLSFLFDYVFKLEKRNKKLEKQVKEKDVDNSF